jgi:hypothetical protein
MIVATFFNNPIPTVVVDQSRRDDRCPYMRSREPLFRDDDVGLLVMLGDHGIHHVTAAHALLSETLHVRTFPIDERDGDHQPGTTRTGHGRLPCHREALMLGERDEANNCADVVRQKSGGAAMAFYTTRPKV